MVGCRKWVWIMNIKWSAIFYQVISPLGQISKSIGSDAVSIIWLLKNSFRNSNLADKAYNDDSGRAICFSIFACFHIFPPAGLESRRIVKPQGNSLNGIMQALGMINSDFHKSGGKLLPLLCNGTNVFGMMNQNKATTTKGKM